MRRIKLTYDERYARATYGIADGIRHIRASDDKSGVCGVPLSHVEYLRGRDCGFCALIFEAAANLAKGICLKRNNAWKVEKSLTATQ